MYFFLIKMQLFWYADLISVKIVVFPLQLLSLRLPQGIPGCSSFMYMCVILFIYDSSDLYHSVVSNFPLAPLLCAAVLYKDEFSAKQGRTGQNRIRTFNYQLWGIFFYCAFLQFLLCLRGIKLDNFDIIILYRGCWKICIEFLRKCVFHVGIF